jgi:phenylacetic acid degradation protein paaN
MSNLSTPKTSAKVEPLFHQHKHIIEKASEALKARQFYAHWPEMPKAYGEDTGKAAYEAQVGKPFTRLHQASDSNIVSDEASPYTSEKLGISYPAFANPANYVEASKKAMQTWKQTDVHTRAALLAESLLRMEKDFFEIAYATQHTTGQAFMMSFQASGPHAADRALEAIAIGYEELTRYPDEVLWEKPMGKVNARLKKYFKAVPRGVALAIGCSTFPVWNSIPGIYASLITGNSVIVKPHPLGIYSIALVVGRIQEVLAEYGFDPHTVLLAPDTAGSPITKVLAEAEDVKIIDFTGSSHFGNYVESLAGKVTFTEKAGVNSVILDSAADLKAVLDNLAFSVSLYSGQMCTAPQNFFIPKGGINIAGENVSFDAVADAFVQNVKGLNAHEKVGPAVAGAIQSDVTLKRVHGIKALGAKVLLESFAIANPEFPAARTASPVILQVDASQGELYSGEHFGPIVLLIATDSTEHSIHLAKTLAMKHGAISCAAYTTDEKVMDHIATEMAEAATSVSFNLTGGVYVNQNAGFSDFHVSGGNPAGNASFTDPEFIVKRFNYVGLRVNE